MGKWHVFEVRKDGDHNADEFFEFHEGVEAWLTANCKKRFKLFVATQRDGVPEKSLAALQRYGPTSYHRTKVMLKGKRDAALFKMFYGEYEFDYASFDLVLLSVIRRAFPSLIAQSIIGVQPMTGPVGSIFTGLKVNYGNSACNPSTSSNGSSQTNSCTK